MPSGGSLPYMPSSGSLSHMPSGGSLSYIPSGGSLLYVAASHTCPVVAASHTCPMVAVSHTCPVVAASHTCPVVAASHTCPVVAASHTCPVVAVFHTCLVVAASHTCPVVAASHTYPVVAASHTCPVVATCMMYLTSGGNVMYPSGRITNAKYSAQCSSKLVAVGQNNVYYVHIYVHVDTVAIILCTQVCQNMTTIKHILHTQELSQQESGKPLVNLNIQFLSNWPTSCLQPFGIVGQTVRQSNICMPFAVGQDGPLSTTR